MLLSNVTKTRKKFKAQWQILCHTSIFADTKKLLKSCISTFVNNMSKLPFQLLFLKSEIEQNEQKCDSFDFTNIVKWQNYYKILLLNICTTVHVYCYCSCVSLQKIQKYIHIAPQKNLRDIIKIPEKTARILTLQHAMRKVLLK
jgi:hypothetical protein